MFVISCRERLPNRIYNYSFIDLIRFFFFLFERYKFIQFYVTVQML